jgi:hypothetical protein
VSNLWRRSISTALVAATVFGCTSPESERTRGGGPGADVGNHPAGPVQIHAGASMYYETPTHGPEIGRHTDIGGAVPVRAQ